MSKRLSALLLCAFITLPVFAQASLETLFDDIEPAVIEWRRDFHANPELSNREFRTAAIVADHLAQRLDVTAERRQRILESIRSRDTAQNTGQATHALQDELRRRNWLGEPDVSA